MPHGGRRRPLHFAARMSWSWPYLTSEIPGVPAQIKRRWEDFVVDEVPAYPASGEGDHIYLRIEKRGLTTPDAVRIVSRELGVPPRNVGFAGQKDAQGITRQWLSVEHVDPERARAIGGERLRVLEVARHRNKLKLGHLRANRFALKLRGVEPERHDDVRAVLELLERRGVPNYFGPQRFGVRGDTWIVGRALLHGDFAEAVAQIAGRAGPLDSGDILRARRLFDQGEYERAAKAWPGGFRDCVRLCGAMAKSGGNPKRSIRAVDRTLLRFSVGAYQSHLFNETLARRIGALDQVLAGDLAWKHDNGAVFLVEDAAVEAPRAARFEISPTGPMFGRRMSECGGEPAQIERDVLERAGDTAEAFTRRGPWQTQGGRRPLRFKMGELAFEFGSDEAGAFVELRFTLPPGAYATAVVGEIVK
jgi:tRNA pseudouridine13 synthase